jgi:hypothetical protein
MSSNPLDIAAFITRWSLAHRGIWRRDHAATAAALNDAIEDEFPDVRHEEIVSALRMLRGLRSAAPHVA